MLPMALSVKSTANKSFTFHFFCLSSNFAQDQKETHAVRSIGGHERRSGRLQALFMGAKRVRQRADVPRMVVDENRERREGQLFGPEIRQDAGEDQVADAGGYSGQPAEPRGNRSNPKAVQER